MTDDAIPTPKQARAVVTRNKIVQAAIDCLTEHGYAGASTTVIARRAGVSQGALFKHFPAKPLLLGVATAEVFTLMRARFVQELVERATPGREMLDGLELLWEIYRDPRLQAVFELYVATRTDDALGEVLRPVVADHYEGIMDIAAALFPAAAGTDEFAQAVTSLMLTLQGAALMIGMAPGGHDTRLPLEFVGQFAVGLLGPPNVQALGAPDGGE